MKENNLNINDIVRIKAVVLDSNYPDEIVNKIVDGLDDLFEKTKAFDKIFNAVNAPYVEYPEDWMVDVLKVVRNFEQEANND